jgi:hypothetical protein
MSLEVHTIDKVKGVFILSGLRFLKLLAKESQSDLSGMSSFPAFRVSRALQYLDSATVCMMFQAKLVIDIPSANTCNNGCLAPYITSQDTKRPEFV